MGRTKSGTSKHSEGGLYYHGHVDDDAVTHTDAESLEDGGQLARLGHDLCISPSSLNTCVNAIFKEADAITFSILNMSIKTVVGHIGHTPFVPPMHVLIASVNRG